jgi:hypothetical protein
MLQNIKTTLTVIKNIPYYIGLFYKAIEVRNGATAALREFPGIDDEDLLFRWCTENSDRLVNYATYTTFTTVDDYLAWQIRLIVHDNWSVIIKAIKTLKNGNATDIEVAKLMYEEIFDSKNLYGENENETKDPFTVITIVSIIVGLVRLIVAAKDDNDPEVVPDDVQPKKRPVLNLIRKLLGK